MRISTQQKTQTTLWTTLFVAAAIWAIVESFQENYFSNSNPGSKTASILYLIHSAIGFLMLVGILGTIGLIGKINKPILGIGFIFVMWFFFDLVFLLNVWKTSGVFFEKESNASLIFIRIYLFVSLIASLFLARPMVTFYAGTR
jgi:hypothetical protein